MQHAANGSSPPMVLVYKNGPKLPSMGSAADGRSQPIVLKNSVSAQSRSISQNTFPLKLLFINHVCQGLHSENHVPVFERDFTAAEFFNKISP